MVLFYDVPHDFAPIAARILRSALASLLSSPVSLRHSALSLKKQRGKKTTSMQKIIVLNFGHETATVFRIELTRLFFHDAFL